MIKHSFQKFQRWSDKRYVEYLAEYPHNRILCSFLALGHVVVMGAVQCVSGWLAATFPLLPSSDKQTMSGDFAKYPRELQL